MLKSEIIEKLQRKHNNLNSYDIELILKIFFKKIISSLKIGNTIEIRGFGTIKKKKLTKKNRSETQKITNFYLKIKLINFILKLAKLFIKN